MKVMSPYLNYNGTTEEAFNYYKSVLGGEITSLQRYKDMPGGDKSPEETKEKIMHIRLDFSGNSLMASDAVPGMGSKLNVGNNVYLSLQADTKEEADKLFNGLSSGGKVEMPMQEVFWGSYFGMTEDKYGVHWMISLDQFPQ